MPDSVIFALGTLSGIFLTLLVWGYIEKRREVQFYEDEEVE